MAAVVEPLMYLLTMGVGLGKLVGHAPGVAGDVSSEELYDVVFCSHSGTAARQEPGGSTAVRKATDSWPPSIRCVGVAGVAMAAEQLPLGIASLNTPEAPGRSPAAGRAATSAQRSAAGNLCVVALRVATARHAVGAATARTREAAYAQ